MNKLADAFSVLKRLSKREQAVAAQAIFDFAAGAASLELSDAQAAQVRSRMQQRMARTLSPAAVRGRLKKLGR